MTFWSALGWLTLLVWIGVIAGWKLAAAMRVAADGELARHGWLPARVLWMAAGVVLIGAGSFLCLARALQAASHLPMDVWAAGLARDAWSPVLQSAMLAITDLGDPWCLAGLGTLVGIVLWRRRKVGLLFGWIAALGGNALWNPGLKLIFERLRPTREVGRLAVEGYSFPSGHSSGSMVGFGMLAYVGCRLLPARWHLPICMLAATLILAVGASRVFLQAHFASDVLAGYGSGAAWLACCVAGCALGRRAHGAYHAD